jgi:FdhD protein
MSETSFGTDSPALSWSIDRVHAGTHEQAGDQVVLEEPLEIVINGQVTAVLMRMPGNEKELAAGFCISEGYVRSAADILLIHHCGLGHPSPTEREPEALESRNRVEIRVTPESFSPPEQPDVIRLIRSGCGAAEVSALSETLPHVSQKLSIPARILLGLGREMRAGQQVHREVGGTHAAALFGRAGKVIALAEDIGRHNAVDKVIGRGLIWGTPLTDKVLVTSGRASYEMVVKAIRVGIPVVASVSAPTSLAVQLAQDRGLTLVGYLRGGRMNVYTHAHRIAYT